MNKTLLGIVNLGQMILNGWAVACFIGEQYTKATVLVLAAISIQLDIVLEFLKVKEKK